MIRPFAFAAAALIAVLPLPASAQTLDISTLKCSDVASMEAEEVGLILAWIDGYLGGRADDTRFDISRFEENGDAAAKACEKDPDSGLLTVLKAAENN
jgi:hypothetical protein